MEKSKALQKKLQAAINDQKRRLEEIKTYYDFLKGKQYSSKPKKDETTFNICHTNTQVIIDSILRGKSHIYVEPITKEAVGTEELLEKVINEYWLKLKVKYQLQFTVTDYIASGLGITYVDWDFEMDKNGLIVNDDPFVLNIPYSKFLIDPEFEPQEVMKAKYMIRKFVKNTEEIKADSRYKHTKNIKGDVKLSSEIYKDVDAKELEQTTLYQIWIPEDECSYVMRDGSEDILRTVENKFGREYPFVLMQNYFMPEESFPYGDIKILYEPQKSLNRIYSLILSHARRVSTRQFAKNDLLKIEEARKLKDAEDGEIISIEGNARPNDAIVPIADAPLSVDVYRTLELVSDMVTQLSRISEYRHSVMPQKQRKATEAVYVEQGTEISTTAKYEDIQEHSEEIARKLFILLKNSDNINTREITYKDKMGQFITANYNFASFPGEYSYRWESGMEAPMNANSKQQKDLAVVNAIALVIAQNPDIKARINWMELLTNILEDMDVKNIEEVLTPEQPIEQAVPEGMIPGGLTPEETVQEEIEGTPPDLMNLVMQNLQGGGI